MMELLLNVLWLAVALAAFALCTRGGRDRRRIVVTACIVALLFPIISITDDLAASVAAVEETVAARRVMDADAHIIVAVALTFVAFVVETPFTIPAAPALTADALRGPPLACR
ncbi:MAG TPA: hypothetical protein VG323_18040 [Thermoanaerobaculia bacterium]|nr:hypothetical protein [Thermoanaerobaculia bacterium]